MLRKKKVVFEGLNVLGYNDNGSNSAQESSPNKDSNGSSDHVSANELSTGKEMAHHVVSCVHTAQEEVFKQGHMIDRKPAT